MSEGFHAAIFETASKLQSRIRMLNFAWQLENVYTNREFNGICIKPDLVFDCSLIKKIVLQKEVSFYGRQAS